MSVKKDKIGIIGGSAVVGFEGLKKVKEVTVRTPFGMPSDKLTTGVYEGVDMVFLPRHGKGHRIPPNQVNYRANICALKMLGVTRVVTVSAVGSMKEEIKPGHLVVPHQYYDRTICRQRSFFDDGIVAHVMFADPICLDLSKTLAECARRTGAVVHEGGTYICIDGPQFSTKAESRVFSSYGVDIIGMTGLPEARLAREAEMCYATLALSTDYDCWHESEETVNSAMVVEVMMKNIEKAREVLKALIPELGKAGEIKCACGKALENSIVTDPKKITPVIKKRLRPIAGKYLEPSKRGK